MRVKSRIHAVLNQPHYIYLSIIRGMVWCSETSFYKKITGGKYVSPVNDVGLH